MTDKQHLTKILESANELMRDAESQEDTEFLVNKRLFNNAFAGVMHKGVPASISDDGSIITIVVGNNSYIGRAVSIQTILRKDYEVDLEKCCYFHEPDMAELETETEYPDIAEEYEIPGIPEYDTTEEINAVPEIMDTENDTVNDVPEISEDTLSKALIPPVQETPETKTKPEETAVVEVNVEPEADPEREEDPGTETADHERVEESEEKTVEEIPQENEVDHQPGELQEVSEDNAVPKKKKHRNKHKHKNGDGLSRTLSDSVPAEPSIGYGLVNDDYEFMGYGEDDTEPIGFSLITEPVIEEKKEEQAAATSEPVRMEIESENAEETVPYAEQEEKTLSILSAFREEKSEAYNNPENENTNNEPADEEPEDEGTVPDYTMLNIASFRRPAETEINDDAEEEENYDKPLSIAVNSPVQEESKADDSESVPSVFEKHEETEKESYRAVLRVEAAQAEPENSFGSEFGFDIFGSGFDDEPEEEELQPELTEPEEREDEAQESPFKLRIVDESDEAEEAYEGFFTGRESKESKNGGNLVGAVLTPDMMPGIPANLAMPKELFKPGGSIEEDDGDNSENVVSIAPAAADMKETKKTAEPKKERKGLFSGIFGRKEKNKAKVEKPKTEVTKEPAYEKKQIVPAEEFGNVKPASGIGFESKVAIVNRETIYEPQKEVVDIAPEIIKEALTLRDYRNDGGELFMHRKVIRLKKMFGSDEYGPYEFRFWPVNAPKTLDRKFAEMLILVLDRVNKKEELYMCDAQNPECNIKLDDKDIKMYGIWEDGKFTPYVTLAGKTASIFSKLEKSEENIPDMVDNIFFEQFRVEKKGQPRHFIVPLESSNGGESNIPIVGYVETPNGVKTLLTRRAGNTLVYKVSGRQKVITGHFEEGKFKIEIN